MTAKRPLLGEHFKTGKYPKFWTDENDSAEILTDHPLSSVVQRTTGYKSDGHQGSHVLCVAENEILGVKRSQVLTSQQSVNLCSNPRAVAAQICVSHRMGDMQKLEKSTSLDKEMTPNEKACPVASPSSGKITCFHSAR